jgi:hypothetical protein
MKNSRVRILLNFLGLLPAAPTKALAAQRGAAVEVSLKFQAPAMTLDEPIILSVEVRKQHGQADRCEYPCYGLAVL